MIDRSQCATAELGSARPAWALRSSPRRVCPRVLTNVLKPHPKSEKLDHRRRGTLCPFDGSQAFPRSDGLWARQAQIPLTPIPPYNSRPHIRGRPGKATDIWKIEGVREEFGMDLPKAVCLLPRLMVRPPLYFVSHSRRRILPVYLQSSPRHCGAAFA